MKEFRVTIPFLDYITFTVRSDSFEGAVDEACERADDLGLDTYVGSVRVEDEHHNPVYPTDT
jgi:hypothetical protein